MKIGGKTYMPLAMRSLSKQRMVIKNDFAISAYFSQKAFKQWDSYVRLSTPNGYISETVDSTGILGGQSNYKISKDMKIKAVVIEQKQYQFGHNTITINFTWGWGYGRNHW